MTTMMKMILVMRTVVTITMTTMVKMILVMRTIVTMMMMTEITTTLEMSATHGFHRHKERASGEI